MEQLQVSHSLSFEATVDRGHDRISVVMTKPSYAFARTHASKCPNAGNTVASHALLPALTIRPTFKVAIFLFQMCNGAIFVSSNISLMTRAEVIYLHYHIRWF